MTIVGAMSSLFLLNYLFHLPLRLPLAIPCFRVVSALLYFPSCVPSLQYCWTVISPFESLIICLCPCVDAVLELSFKRLVRFGVYCYQ